MEETSSSKVAMADASAAVAADLKTVIRDIQVLLKAAAASGTEVAGSYREQLEVALLKLQARLVEVEKTAAARAAELGRSADTYVRENPWRAVGAAAGAGLILGMLITRR
ncbi:MAG: DUF883 domain-containing protein [Comamonadaceae bacterium]|nr:MAG: DUF883 domain-containing protein [Comamonadaceae bacterium]